MATNITPGGGVRLLRRFAPILAGLVGLVFLVVGGVLLLSQGWDRVTGEISGPCVSRIDRTGTSRHTVQTCDVTWTDGGMRHTSQIDLSGGRVHSAGETLDLRVHGTTITQATPVWAGAATVAVGLALVVPAVVLVVRRRR